MSKAAVMLRGMLSSDTGLVPHQSHIANQLSPLTVSCCREPNRGIGKRVSKPMSTLAEGGCFAEVTGEPLDVLKYSQLVSDPGAGAIASFMGVTRDTFQGKAVEKLEYEAYVPMALKKLLEICQVACSRWDLKKIAVAHRTGTVHISEASACHWAIDELKATVPIWKKEFFAGGEVWKENEDSRQLLAPTQQ